MVKALIKNSLILVLATLAYVSQAFADLNDEGLIFHDIRIMATDLVDEMAYQWLKSPPFPTTKNLILADLSAPIGIDHRFNEFVENRLYEIFSSNPQIPFRPVHCSTCLQWTAVANPKQTVISRGIDQPEVLQNLDKLSPDQLALSLNFEAQGRDLVLRAQIFEMAPPQKIVWARTYSTSMSRAEVMRDKANLMSLEAAREMQQQILRGKEPLSTFTRIKIRNFQAQGSTGQVAPLIFIAQSLEATLLPQRNKKFAVEVGFSSIKNSLQGWSVGGNFAQLIGRKTPSLVDPDVYWFAGVEYMALEGPGAAPFSQKQIDVARLVNAKEDPKAGMTFLRFGLEGLIKHRFGMAVYIEHAPILEDSEIIKTQKLLFIPYQSLGVSLVAQW